MSSPATATAATERPPPSSHEEEETTLVAGRYLIVDVLGSGGMGTVYRAMDTELEEEVALKILQPSSATDEGALARFRREVKLARRVTHSNVARTYDLGKHDGTPFLTMELIVGESLAAKLDRLRRLSLVETLRIAWEVSCGLAAAHAAGVVHRDLKPDNIVLARPEREGESDRAVLTDFGIAILARDGDSKLTQAVGTPAYMAPEQVRGTEVDGRADVYALGVALFELLTGQLPFAGSNVYTLATARLGVAPPDVRSLDASVPLAVADLVRSMMSEHREYRPDAESVREWIERLRGEAGAGAFSRLPAASSLAERPAPRLAHTVVILPFEPAGAEADGIAEAVTDALAALGGALTIVPPALARPMLSDHVRGGSVDLVALATALSATHVLQGTVRSIGEGWRVRLCLLEPLASAQRWAGTCDGTSVALVDLERDAARLAVHALTAELRLDDARGFSSTSPDLRASTRLPKSQRSMNPDARVHYEEAQTFRDFGDADHAIRLLRLADSLEPENPYIMSALGAALVRLWSHNGDRSLLTEAEDYSLRALAIDAELGETFNTIGVLRVHQGQLRAAVRAFEAALVRAPRLSEPHSYLGRFLSESGRLNEAVARLRAAIELDPRDHNAVSELARIAALKGNWVGAESALERGADASNHALIRATQARYALWRDDRDRLRELVAEMEGKRDDPTLAVVMRLFVPAWKALVAREPLSADDERLTRIRDAAQAGSLRLGAFFCQLLAEINVAAGHLPEALSAIETARDRGLIDVLWLDKCPAIAVLRPDPRFARVRAAVASRAAELWR